MVQNHFREYKQINEQINLTMESRLNKSINQLIEEETYFNKQKWINEYTLKYKLQQSYEQLKGMIYRFKEATLQQYLSNLRAYNQKMKSLSRVQQISYLFA